MKKYTSPFKIYWITSAIIFSIIAGFLFWYFREWNWLLLHFIAINATIGCLYLWDKIIAGSEKVIRVPELVLHTLALLGGSPIALLSQKIFRHKTSKKSFIVVYWLIVLIQVGIVVWFFKDILFEN